MAAIRCSKCNIPMTQSEARTGRCPVCQERLAILAPEPGTSSPAARSITATASEPRAPLGKVALCAILFAAGVTGAVVDAAVHGFRSGTGTTGAIAGIGLSYGVLHGLKLVGKKA